MEAVIFRQMSAHVKFVWGAIKLLLDVYDDQRRLERPLHDVLHFFAVERTVHSLGSDFFSQVGQDFFVVF